MHWPQSILLLPQPSQVEAGNKQERVIYGTLLFMTSQALSDGLLQVPVSAVHCAIGLNPNGGNKDEQWSWWRRHRLGQGRWQLGRLQPLQVESIPVPGADGRRSCRGRPGAPLVGQTQRRQMPQLGVPLREHQLLHPDVKVL